jgi:predicted ribosome quality control (RQC) complex YloA/Tae2 family protein
LTSLPTYPHHVGVSNKIRYDTLLVRELARELDTGLAGQRLEAAFFDRERLRLTLHTRAPRRTAAHPPSLLWHLHPGSGHITPAPVGAGGGRLQLQAPLITGVYAPPDERILIIDLQSHAEGGASQPARIVVELLTNQWNALAVGADGRILAALRERVTRDRVLKPGEAYTLPRPSGRPGGDVPLTLAEWEELLGPAAPGERLPALPRLVAYASPMNAGWILGDADISDRRAALEAAYSRYLQFLWSDNPRPVLLPGSDGWQPYVSPDPAAEQVDALLSAFALAATRAELAPPTAAVTEDALDAVAARLDALEKRCRRLGEEQAGAADEARRLRTQADVLISNLHLLQRGARSVVLPDFEGAPLEVELDPGLSGADNAGRLYDAARRRDRAAARIPELLRRAAAERARLEQLAQRVREGTASAEELERLRRTPTGSRPAAPLLPYRTYRTSGGLEVRVGRGSRANDDLTFRHSSPNDIWLHARDVAGAHVILRWARADSNPPARDVTEAAVLAALHSRARSSGTVPVDWTRRKHVRKPRKAGPGLVIPERVKTVFVEPDSAIEERLRVETDLA